MRYQKNDEEEEAVTQEDIDKVEKELIKELKNLLFEEDEEYVYLKKRKKGK